MSARDLRDVFRWTKCQCSSDCGGWEIGSGDWYFWTDREPGSEGASLCRVHNLPKPDFGPFGDWQFLEQKMASIITDSISEALGLLREIKETT